MGGLSNANTGRFKAAYDLAYREEILENYL